MNKRVAIIGGGISGLSAANALINAGADVVLYEKNSFVGGNIQSIKRDGFLYEHGPNSTLTSQALLDLIEELGLTDQIAAPSSSSKKRFIVREGRLVALPSDPMSLILTKAVSGGSKWNLLKEPFLRNEGVPSESVASFFTRRVGKEIVDYAVDPFVSGIYAGDPEKLAIEHAFPRLFELERDFGSIVKGALLAPKKKKAKLPKGTPRSMSLKGGLQTIVDALEAKLATSIRKNCGAVTLDKRAGGKVTIATATDSEDFDAAIVCTPAYVTADILKNIDAELARELAGIYYPPVSVVYAGFRRQDVEVQPDGFGFLVPGIEKRKILGCLWTSSIFEGRAPEGHHLLTTFIGGSRNPYLCERSEDELTAIALDELRKLMGVNGDPVFTAVKKWPRAIPQYNIGYAAVIDAISHFRMQNPEISVCGNYYKGTSVSDCVKNGAIAANEMLEFLDAQNS